MSRYRRAVGLGIASLLVLGLVVLTTVVRSAITGGETRELDAVVAALEATRAAADSCRLALEHEQAEFDAFDRHVDSLRAAVRAFESRERTVPADAFAEYLAVFDEYNESVTVWHERADALRASWSACRDLAETHNMLADSATTLLYGPVGAEPD